MMMTTTTINNRMILFVFNLASVRAVLFFGAVKTTARSTTQKGVFTMAQEPKILRTKHS